MKASCYLQVEPIWHWNHPERLMGMKVARVTSKKPIKPISGCIVVKLGLNVADQAFMPLQPTVEVTIPAEHVEMVQVTSVPVEVQA